MNEDEHTRLREMLGSYSLGHLPEAEVARVRAHLEGCAECRAELETIAPLAALLRSVDPAVFAAPPTPPPDLGERIRHQVAAEREQRDADERARRRDEHARSRRRRLAGALVAAVVLIAGIGTGVVVGRSTAPLSPAAAPVPLEPIALLPTPAGLGAGLEVSEAGLVPHTWGTELRMEAAGFAEGAVFRAQMRDADGRWTPAGEFLGIGAASMTCNLQSSVLRDDVVEIVVRDRGGRPVLRARL